MMTKLSSHVNSQDRDLGGTYDWEMKHLNWGKLVLKIHNSFSDTYLQMMAAVHLLDIAFVSLFM